MRTLLRSLLVVALVPGLASAQGGATAKVDFRTAVQPLLKDGQVVIDLVRAFGSRRSDAKYQGICW